MCSQWKKVQRLWIKARAPGLMARRHVQEIANGSWTSLTRFNKCSTLKMEQCKWPEVELDCRFAQVNLSAKRHDPWKLANAHACKRKGCCEWLCFHSGCVQISIHGQCSHHVWSEKAWILNERLSLPLSLLQLDGKAVECRILPPFLGSSLRPRIKVSGWLDPSRHQHILVYLYMWWVGSGAWAVKHSVSVTVLGRFGYNNPHYIKIDMCVYTR